MGENSAISWCDNTFNPFIGCSKVGPGCDGCYAERDNARRKWVEGWGPGQPRRRTSESYWRQPLTWDRKAKAAGKPLKVFCASLADVFDNEVPQAWRDDLWALIRATPNLRWILLTKRIGNAAKMLPPDWPVAYPNAGLMATVVNQEEWDRDVPKLMAIPAWWRGVSAEPLLGPIKFGPWRPNWLIVGGESGPKARPMHPAWAISLRDQCAAAGIPYHLKQWGEWVPVDPGRWDGDPDELDSMFIPNYRPGDMWFGDDGWFAEKPPFVWRPARYAIMRRVGAKKAGCLLDGFEHKNFPAALSA